MPSVNTRCKPCEGGIASLSRAEAHALMKGLSGHWHLALSEKSIQAEWQFANFFRVMSFANAVAHIANTEDHHPVMEVGHNHCRVRFTTDAVGGLSENDFICAAKIDALTRL